MLSYAFKMGQNASLKECHCKTLDLCNTILILYKSTAIINYDLLFIYFRAYFIIIMVILVFFLVISVNRRLFRYFGYSGYFGKSSYRQRSYTHSQPLATNCIPSIVFPFYFCLFF